MGWPKRLTKITWMSLEPLPEFKDRLKRAKKTIYYFKPPKIKIPVEASASSFHITSSLLSYT